MNLNRGARLKVMRWFMSSLISYTSSKEYKQKSSVEFLVYVPTGFAYF
jgi:hypothetical protein